MLRIRNCKITTHSTVHQSNACTYNSAAPNHVRHNLPQSQSKHNTPEIYTTPYIRHMPYRQTMHTSVSPCSGPLYRQPHSSIQKPSLARPSGTEGTAVPDPLCLCGHGAVVHLQPTPRPSYLWLRRPCHTHSAPIMSAPTSHGAHCDATATSVCRTVACTVVTIV